ncbi:PA2169 family four-helix-bundle protein [Chitinophagaceae bacterium MMS25-I14]
MEQQKVISDTLNDLVKINNDRIAGYQKAIDETKGLDMDLRAIFSNFIEDSRRYNDELAAFIAKNEGKVAEGTTLSGQIYRTWMDVKAAITGADRKSILASCAFGESAAEKAYATALSRLPEGSDAYQLVSEQQQSLNMAQDIIKTHHEAHRNL